MTINPSERYQLLMMKCPRCLFNNNAWFGNPSYLLEGVGRGYFCCDKCNFRFVVDHKNLRESCSNLDTPIFGSPFFDRELPVLRGQLREFSTRLRYIDRTSAGRTEICIKNLVEALKELELDAKRVSLKSRMNDHIAQVEILKQQIVDLGEDLG